MRYKVELEASVRWFLKRQCSAEEREAFYAKLREVAGDPIEHSLPISDPSLSRYMLRFFRVGNIRVVFALDAINELIRVAECKRISKRPPGQRNGNKPP